VAGAVRVFASEGGGEAVFVGDVAVERWVQVVGLLVWEVVQDKDGELVRGIRVRAKK